MSIFAPANQQALGLIRSQKGQASIFMAIFIATMILLFALATNIGMLVHAKINLQNAADAAAYAGASVQARQMTAIAYLNYEMRRAVKQFMFNWMVRGNRAQSCFPIDGNGGTAAGICGRTRPPDDKYTFAFYDPRPGEENEPDQEFLPTTCIIFDSANNYCQKSRVAGIPELGGISGVLAFVNPIIQAVRTSTQIIIDRKIEDCVSRGNANKLFAAAWLFNLDPRPLAIPVGIDSEQPFPAYGSLDALGVLTRQAILRSRIDNFEEALNLNLQNESFADSTIDDGVLERLRSDSRSDYLERPIQAYLSARNNLPTVAQNNGIFSDIKLTEILPVQAAGPKSSAFVENEPILFRTQDISARVKIAASDFESTSVSNRGECRQFRRTFVIQSFPIGVVKDPTVLTFYAVNLKANVRLLFSPFGLDGTVTLSAYSAAKPFGSRIGKDLTFEQSTQVLAAGRPVPDAPLVGAFKFNNQFVNLLVSDFPNKTSETGGFAASGNLGYLRRAMALGGPALGIPRAYRLAGAYNPWEVGFYTVPADFDGISRFPGNPNYRSGTAGRAGFHELRAPIAQVKKSTNDLSFIRTRILGYFSLNSGVLAAGEQNLDMAPIVAEQFSNPRLVLMERFLRELGQDQSHFIPNPLLLDDPELAQYALVAGRNYTVAGKPNQLRQLTSWNTIKSSTHDDPSPPGHELEANMGRAGYSVKFVAFQNLGSGGVGSNDDGKEYSDPFERINPSGSDAQRIVDEIRALQH